MGEMVNITSCMLSFLWCHHRYQLVAIDFLPLPVLRASFKRLSDMLGGQDAVAVPALAYPFAAVATALRQLSQVLDASPPGSSMRHATPCASLLFRTLPLSG